jgi:hypothetical protein
MRKSAAAAALLSAGFFRFSAFGQLRDNDCREHQRTAEVFPGRKPLLKQQRTGNGDNGEMLVLKIPH